MAGLLDLADEILSQIVSYIHPDKPQMAIMSSLCRRIHLILRPRIMRNISLYIRPVRMQHTLFLRTITEHPELALMVCHINLHWFGDEEDGCTHDIANAILG